MTIWRMFIVLATMLTWGLLIMVTHSPRLNLKARTKATITGVSLYVAATSGVVILDGMSDWLILVFTLFLIPVGFGTSFLISKIILLSARMGTIESDTQARSSNRNSLQNIMLGCSLVGTIVMVLLNTPLSLATPAYKPFATGTLSLTVTSIICFLLSSLSVFMALRIAKNGEIFGTVTQRPFSILFAFLPAGYGTIIFLVTGNTVVTVPLDIMAMVAILFSYRLVKSRVKM